MLSNLNCSYMIHGMFKFHAQPRTDPRVEQI